MEQALVLHLGPKSHATPSFDPQNKVPLTLVQNVNL